MEEKHEDDTFLTNHFLIKSLLFLEFNAMTKMCLMKELESCVDTLSSYKDLRKDRIEDI